MIQRRMDLSLESRRIKEKAIVETLLPFLKGKVAAYNPIQGEVDLFSFLRKDDFYFPKVIDDETMEFIPYSGSFQKGRFKVDEPIGHPIDPMDIDVILIPMVAFYVRTRKGYGKGYYDRYLKKTKALKIGIAFDLQEDITIRKQSHDVDMDILITETRRIES